MKPYQEKAGGWELGCIMLNLFLYKLFTRFPSSLVATAGSGAWVSVLFSGVLFLAAVFLITSRFKHPPKRTIFEAAQARFGTAGRIITGILFGAYLFFSALYALRELGAAMRIIAYPRAPMAFLLGFFILAAVIIVLRGRRAVTRLHGIVLPFILVALVMILLFGLRDANGFYLTPVLGTGAQNVFGRGLSALFVYSDILLLPLLLPACKEPVRAGRAVRLAAAAAVVLQSATMAVFLLNAPYEVAAQIDLPIYPLTKITYYGKLLQRLDAVYLVALTAAGMLCLSVYLYLLCRTLGSLHIKKRGREVLAGMLCLALPFTLCGCYDSREVEESAYLIALGIDKGAEQAYRYTFQFSNPLSSGSDSGASQKDAADSEGNKSVNHITLEAQDYYTARSLLDRSLGKTPNLSHLKLIVFSVDLARDGLLQHTQLLQNEREVRPNTDLLLAEDGAESWLKQVKPTLEATTPRYYELLLRQSTMPSAPIVELKEFVNKVSDSAVDAVLPIAKGTELAGMGYFSGDRLAGTLNGEDATLYKVLTGDADQLTFSVEGRSVEISSRRRAACSYQSDTAEITLYTKISYAEPPSAQEKAMVETAVCQRVQALLETAAAAGSDPFGIQQYCKRSCLTQGEWEAKKQQIYMPNTIFFVNINNIGSNYTENLKKFE